ncbi:unnamed protein product [Aphanomyces euteiches]
MSASSESSNPSFSKVTKKPQTSLTISTESELLSNYLSDEILTLSDVGITEIFVNIKECNDPIERDDDMWSELNASMTLGKALPSMSVTPTPVGPQTTFGSPVETTPRQRGDMLLLY